MPRVVKGPWPADEIDAVRQIEDLTARLIAANFRERIKRVAGLGIVSVNLEELRAWAEEIDRGRWHDG